MAQRVFTAGRYAVPHSVPSKETPHGTAHRRRSPQFHRPETTEGPIDFHEWIGDKWAVLFSHPKDFTPVCTTELGYHGAIKPEFDKRNTKIIGLSADPVDDHKRWAKDIEETQGTAVNYPMIGDPELKVAKLYDMLPRRGRAAASAPRPTTPPCARCSSSAPTRKSS